MTSEDYFSMLGVLFVFQFPTLVISSLGLWFSISRKETLGRAANWATWGFVALISYTLVSVALRVALMGIRSNQFIQGGSEAAMSISRLNAWGLAAYPLFVLGLALVARAVFLDRWRTPADR